MVSIRVFGISTDGSLEEVEERSATQIFDDVQEGLCPYCAEPMRRVFLRGREYGTCDKHLWGAYRAEGAYTDMGGQ